MKTVNARLCRHAFTLTELLVIIAVLVLLAGLVLPALTKCSCKAVGINCTNNLKQVGLAFRMWSDDNTAFPMQFQTNGFDGPSYALQQKTYVYFQVMSNELSTPKVVVCPGDAQRTSGTNFTSDFDNSKVSYFVGLDADESRPQMFLAGDRNLTTNGIPVRAGLALIESSDRIGWTTKIHQRRGSIALADGSVQQDSESALQQTFRHVGTNVTRLAIP